MLSEMISVGGFRSWESPCGRVLLVNGDCADVVPLIPIESIDAVVTDPPYGIPNFAAFVRKSTRVIDGGEGSYNETDDPYWWIQLISTQVVNGGHVSFFIDRQTIEAALSTLRSCGPSWWNKYYLVKNAPPPTPRPSFVSAVEECLIAEKRCGSRKWFGGGSVPNRWIGLTPNRAGKSHGHPTEKPLDAIEALCTSLSPEGGLVADPFMGSGTTGVACIRTGRRFIGIEKDVENGYFDISVERCKRELGLVRDKPKNGQCFLEIPD